MWLWIGLLVAVALTGLLGRGFGRYNPKTAATQVGILDFELAGDAVRAGRIVGTWRAAGVDDRVQPNLWLDMVWIPWYAAALALGCTLAARLFAGWWAYAGAAIAAGQVLAGLLDYVENIALLRTFSQVERQNADRAMDRFADSDPPGTHQVSDALPRIAAWCARMKLRLITVGLIYLLMALLFWLLT